jgi:hypothetical protein
MKKTLLRLSVLAALALISTYVVTGGYALFVSFAGPLEGSGHFPWFLWVQWGYEAAFFGIVGYFLPRLLNTTTALGWSFALGLAYAALRLGSSTRVYGELEGLEYISEYGGYVVATIAAVAAAAYATRESRRGPEQHAA